jgi:hypothetical protein
MSEGAVRISFDERPGGGRIGHIAVDNQRRLNCLNSSIVVALRQAFESMAAERELRAVVLTGAGDRSFIGGADLNELQGLCSESARLFITRLHKACKAIRDCPVPVIGRINGFCLGAGLEIAASCDMRAGSENGAFGMPEVHMGLPSVIEAALLPGLIGWGKTREILLNDPRASLTVAAETGGRFIRSDYFVDRMSRQGYGEFAIDPAGLVAFRDSAAPEVLILADIQVKYATMIEARSLQESARLAAMHRADAIVVTGDATGDAPRIESLREAAAGIASSGCEIQLLIGSGLIALNAASLLSACVGAIVGTALMHDRKISEHKTARVMAGVARARSS